MKAICLNNLPVHAIGIHTWSAVFLDGIQVVDNLIFKTKQNEIKGSRSEKVIRYMS